MSVEPLQSLKKRQEQGVEPVETFRAIQEMLQRPGAGEERGKTNITRSKNPKTLQSRIQDYIKNLKVRIFTWEAKASRFLSS